MYELAIMLNAEAHSTTPQQVTKRVGPKKKLRGLLAPVVLVELADQVLGLENEAYVEMGGETKKYLSDLVSEALELYLSTWIAENGPLPESAAERKDFVKRLAARNLLKLREQITEQ